MLEPIISNLDSGVKKIKNNPQLVFTIFVAVIIVGSFVLMADRFIGIANDAEERLVNVRVGSIQDAFVAFAGDRIGDPSYLDSKISEIMHSNATIQSFRVVKKASAAYSGASSSTTAFTTPSVYVVIDSNFKNETGSRDASAEFLYSLAESNPGQSVTIELDSTGERLFSTARAIVDGSGNVIAVAITTQTLSAADATIQSDISNSIYLLIVIIAVILFLFLRHSRIVDYISLYKRLKEVDQLKDDFISMASHELRTPLTVIRGYAEFMSGTPDLSDDLKDYASKIDVSAKSLDSLIADILDVSRIQQGRMSFQMEKIDPAAMLGELVASFELPAKEKGLTISFDKSRAVPGQSISADKERLKQVFVNIIGNAVKYTPKGSVEVSLYPENGQLCVLCKDTGIGISSEERERLFEKFYRVKSKETEDIRGTGLGLWITASIVKDMGGKISLESIKGVGSHFVINFPIIK